MTFYSGTTGAAFRSPSRPSASAPAFRWLLVLFFLAAVLAGRSRAQTSPAAAPAAKGADNPFAKEPYVFELIQQTIRSEADGRGQRELLIRARIQSESAVREFGLLAYPFASSFESLDVVYARVYKPDGSVVETPASDVQELDSAVSREAPMYTDEREKHVAIKSLSAGDILEARLRWTIHDPAAPGHFWHDISYFRSGICLKELVEIDLPLASEVKFQYAEPKPRIREEGNRRIYRFETANLKKPEESKIPAWEREAHGAEPPDLRFTSFASWEQVGGWFATLAKPKMAVTPEIRAKAEELTRGRGTEEEKIRALYDFVSTRFRYIGVDLGLGRYSPHSASDVLSNRYGDCKDKHTLFAALLEAIGVTAYPVLISSRYRIDPELPSMSLFDHLITAIPRGDSYLFLDTTPEVAPFGLLLANLRDRRALVIPSSGEAKLLTTPAESPLHNYEIFRVDSSIDTHGTLDASMSLEERGDGEILLRSAYRSSPQNSWDELTQKIANGMGFAGTVSEVVVGPPEDTSVPFRLSFHYHRTDFPDWKNHRIALPAPFFFLAELNEQQKSSSLPLPLGAAQDVTYESSIRLPKGYSALLSENVRRKTEFADYSASYSLDKAGAVHGTLHLKTLKTEIPGDQRAAFSTLVNDVEETSRRYLYVKGDFPAPEGATLDREILSSMYPSKPADRIGAMERDLADHPDHRGTLLALSHAYIRTGRAKDAAAMLEKALGGDPEDPQALEVALGTAYLAFADTEKAMDQFRKALGDKPEPLTLNGVAYALADANVHLEEALKDSTQSIAKISAATLTVAPEDAQADDFRRMMELSANWDTLGWIKFRMGDVAGAEKYLLSAWQLMQSPEIGGHLAEVYERLGQKHQAAVICLMANAAHGREQDERLVQQMTRLRPFLKPAVASRDNFFSDGSLALSDMRTLQIPAHPKLQGNAQFAHFVISLGSGSNATDVIFASGAEELRNGIAALVSAKYPQTFPDPTPVRILRKGTLSCSIYTKGCTLVLIPAPDAAVPDR